MYQDMCMHSLYARWIYVHMHGVTCIVYVCMECKCLCMKMYLHMQKMYVCILYMYGACACSVCTF